MKGKSKEKVDLPDGTYSARIGGYVVRIKTGEKIVRFDSDVSAGDLSVSIWVRIKNGLASFSNK